MKYELIEEILAYDLIVLATDRLSEHLQEEDWEAAIVASLIKAVEIASQRKVKSIDQIYETKSLRSDSQEAILVQQD